VGWSPFCLFRHLDAVDLSVVAGKGWGEVLERVGEDVEGRQEGRKERRKERRKRGKKKRGIDVCILCGLSILGA
jgi:hypothetical protein